MAQTKIRDTQLANDLGGWIPAGETWTYASATTFTISGDKTDKYQVGDFIKLTQTTVKYFRVTNVSYSSPNTTVTIDGLVLSTFASATVTSPYYSKASNPQGFPQREVELYNNSTGTNGTVTLSETSANFDYLEILYRSNDPVYSSCRVYSPNSKAVDLTTSRYFNGSVYHKTAKKDISGTSITSGSEAEYSYANAGTITVNTNNYIYIVMVVGYRW